MDAHAVNSAVAAVAVIFVAKVRTRRPRSPGCLWLMQAGPTHASTFDCIQCTH